MEIAADIINQRLTSPLDREKVLKDVFLTGGNTLFKGFQERLEMELMAVLPAEAVLRVRKARNPVLDAWNGAAQWARGEGVKGDAVTREEWAEKGSEYLKVCLHVFFRACECSRAKSFVSSSYVRLACLYAAVFPSR